MLSGENGRLSANSYHDKAIGAIKSIIIEDRLKPNDRLPPEDLLVKRIGFSRTVVREAVKYLAARGILETRQGQGTFVRRPGIPMSLDEISLLVHWDRTWLQELVELRLVLELGIADWVVERVTEQDMMRMTAAIMGARRRLEAGELDIREYDCEFHLAYLAAAKNRAVESYGAVIRRFFATGEFAPTVTGPSPVRQSIDEHIEIQQAILRGDRDALREVLRRHLERRLIYCEPSTNIKLGQREQRQVD